MDITTDCRTEVGVTVGLVEALITISRILAQRDLTPPEVREALADMRGDEDVASLTCHTEAHESNAPVDPRVEELFRAVREGKPGAGPVLLDYLVEQKEVPHHIAAEMVEDAMQKKGHASQTGGIDDCP